MLNTFIKITTILAGFYILICLALFIFQEKLIFFPSKIPKNFEFNFEGTHQEINIKAADGALLNGLLFKSEQSKGLIFYLHGNGGTINSWGNVAKTYTDLNYDIFILDYRSYGKSEGKIKSQKQLFSDHQMVYEKLKSLYSEDKIVILGYSIGTGLAAKLAADNNPQKLILQAPYYSLIDMMNHTYPFLPTFILKYKFETNVYLKNCTMPISLIHGTNDQVIYYGSSEKLHQQYENNTTLITLPGQGHNGFTDNPDYLMAIRKILSKH